MSTPSTVNHSAIPYPIAAQLCELIHQENRGRWYTFNAMWCWGCLKFTKGDLSKRCFNSQPDCRGCAQVNTKPDSQDSGQRE